MTRSGQELNNDKAVWADIVYTALKNMTLDLSSDEDYFLICNLLSDYEANLLQ